MSDVATRTSTSSPRSRQPPGRYLGQARRMLEKYRVQRWAQQLGAAQTVSDARIRTMLSP